MKRITIVALTLAVLLLLTGFGKLVQSITLRINWDEDSKQNDFVQIFQKDRKILKNGVESQYFDLHFFKDSKKSGVFPVEIRGHVKEAEWDAESPFLIDSTHQRNDFVVLHNGFPACGYSQNFFLFVKNADNKIQLLDEWETFFDAPYGNFQLFKPIDENSFARITVNIEGSDQETKEGEEEMATVTKSDSVVFYQKKNRWIKKEITKKGKEFWQRNMKFDEAYHYKF